jgi:hypothetical protein
LAKKLDLLKEQLSFLQIHNASDEEIQELELKIVRSKRGKSSRTKGASYERDVAKKFMKRFPQLDLVRTPSSGGFKKSANNKTLRGDTSNVNEDYEFMLHIEAKNQAKIQIEKWIKQAEEDCPEGKIPAVVFHKQQKIEDGKRTEKARDYICLPFEDFLEIVDDRVVELLTEGN